MKIDDLKTLLYDIFIVIILSVVVIASIVGIRQGLAYLTMINSKEDTYNVRIVNYKHRIDTLIVREIHIDSSTYYSIIRARQWKDK